MSLFSRLFGGGGSSPKPEPDTYKGFSIFAEPVKEPGGYRVYARIEKVTDGTTQSHELIRADVCSSLDDALEISVGKAKILIDEQGEQMFR